MPYSGSVPGSKKVAPEREQRAGWWLMTVASPAGTPLILAVLALGIAFLSAVGSLAAVLMARANVHRQIEVATREACMREFREQVAQVLAGIMNAKAAGGALADAAVASEIARAATVSFHAVGLLIAEKGTQYGGFMEIMNRLLVVANRPADATDWFDLPDRITEVSVAAANILRQERALTEVNAWPSWSRFVAWLRRDPPRFPT